MYYTNNNKEMKYLPDSLVDWLDDCITDKVNSAEINLSVRKDNIEAKINDIFAKYTTEYHFGEWKSFDFAENNFNDEDYKDYEALCTEYQDLEEYPDEELPKLRKLLEEAKEIAKFLIEEYDGEILQ